MSEHAPRTAPNPARWKRVANVVQAEMAPEQAALLHLGTGQYHALNAVGTRIWALLQLPRTLDELCAALCMEYDVDPERCTDEVATYLDVLHAARLIEAVT